TRSTRTPGGCCSARSTRCTGSASLAAVRPRPPSQELISQNQPFAPVSSMPAARAMRASCRRERQTRMRYAAAVGGVVLGLVMSASADAQTTFERGWIDVNLGVAVAAEDAFSMRASGEIFSEQADF